MAARATRAAPTVAERIAECYSDAPWSLIGNGLPTLPVEVLMERKMLLGIKARAERRPGLSGSPGPAESTAPAGLGRVGRLSRAGTRGRAGRTRRVDRTGRTERAGGAGCTDGSCRCGLWLTQASQDLFDPQPDGVRPLVGEVEHPPVQQPEKTLTGRSQQAALGRREPHDDAPRAPADGTPPAPGRSRIPTAVPTALSRQAPSTRSPSRAARRRPAPAR